MDRGPGTKGLRFVPKKIERLFSCVGYEIAVPLVWRSYWICGWKDISCVSLGYVLCFCYGDWLILFVPGRCEIWRGFIERAGLCRRQSTG